MQAICHHPPGGTEKLKIGKENIPEIDDDEILVKISAASVI
jgi:NADPH:quinone reductase-like Zn-dependent oxidoreductase